MKLNQTCHSETCFLNFSNNLTVELIAFTVQDYEELNLKYTFLIILYAVKKNPIAL